MDGPVAHVLGHGVAFAVARVVEAQKSEVAGGTRGDLEPSYEAPLAETLAAIDGTMG